MKTEPKTLRTGAAYIRVSTNDQTELSPDAQKRLIIDYAKKNNIILSEDFIFHENGISGKKADKRPEFQRMIGLAKSQDHPFDIILVWKFSRFARNQEESIVYKSMLRKDKVEVVSISEPLIDGPFGSLIERIIEWMDEYYSIRLSGEVVRGMTEKAMRGGYQSTPCLGYQAVGQGQPHIIDEKEITIVKAIFHYYTEEMMDLTAIARKLNEAGYRTKRGNPFEKRNIALVITNPFYIGKVSWRGIVFDGEHETRITPEQFEKAQNRYRQEYRPLKRRNVSTCKHWLSGLLICPICGASLAYNKTKLKSFQCWRYAKGMHKGSVSISDRKVIAALLKSMETAITNKSIVFDVSKADYELSVNIQFYRDQLEVISAKELRVKEAYECGIDTLEEYRLNKERLGKEREEILAAMAAEKTPASEPVTQEEVLFRIQSVYEIISDPDINFEIKGNACRSVLKKIIYDREKNKFYFFYYA